jgi:hypothetical protein
MKIAPSPTLAVVVPATNEPPTLPACLRALRDSTVEPAELHVVGEPVGVGPAAARNLGAARSSADVIVFVDADVSVHPDALARIDARFAADPGLAGVFGAYDDSPAAPGTVSRFRNLLHHHVHTSSPGSAETFWAGLGAVRREAFERVGGFDSRRFVAPSVEDIELGARLRRAGERIELDPEIRGTHHKRWRLVTMLRADFSARALPWARLILERRAPANALNTAPRGRASAGLALLATAAALARRPLATLAALVALAAGERDLLRLLRRRGGTALAAAGLPLLVLHHLAAVAALPVAAAAHLIGTGPRR